MCQVTRGIRLLRQSHRKTLVPPRLARPRTNGVRVISRAVRTLWRTPARVRRTVTPAAVTPAIHRSRRRTPMTTALLQRAPIPAPRLVHRVRVRRLVVGECRVRGTPARRAVPGFPAGRGRAPRAVRAASVDRLRVALWRVVLRPRVRSVSVVALLVVQERERRRAWAACREWAGPGDGRAIRTVSTKVSPNGWSTSAIPRSCWGRGHRLRRPFSVSMRVRFGRANGKLCGARKRRSRLVLSPSRLINPRRTTGVQDQGNGASSVDEMAFHIRRVHLCSTGIRS